MALAYKNQFVSSSIIGEYIDEPGGLVYLRNLVNNYTMSEYNTIDLEPNGVTEEHDRSVIFSGSLWDFRRDNDVNSSIADELVLESLNNLDNSPSFLDGRDALKAAAIASGYSNYTDEIDVAFANHEIGQAPSPLSVTISGPSSLNYNEQGTFMANPSGGSGTYTNYRWWWRNDAGVVGPYYVPQGDYRYELTALEGQQTITIGKPDDFSLKCEVTDSDDNTATDIHSVIVGGPSLSKEQQNNTKTITAVPKELTLAGNYPNPFNPTTTIRFGLPESQHVEINVYSITGELVNTLINDYLSEGYHQVVWDGANKQGSKVGTGIYIYEMRTKNKRLIRKMLLAK